MTPPVQKYPWRKWRAVCTALLFVAFYAPWLNAWASGQAPASAPLPTAGDQLSAPYAFFFATYLVILNAPFVFRLNFFCLTVGIIWLWVYILTSIMVVVMAPRDPWRHVIIGPLVLTILLSVLGLGNFLWWSVVAFDPAFYPIQLSLSDALGAFAWGFWLTLMLLGASLVVETLELFQTLRRGAAARRKKVLAAGPALTG